MAGQLYAGSGVLLRSMLRQDRLRIAIWIVSFTALCLVVASAYNGLYATEQERQAIAVTMENPAMTAMLGIGYGLQNYTLGAMMAHQMLLITAVLVGIMNVLMVARHTRAEEEEGRVELVRALPAGRLAPLHAAVLSAVVVNVLLALIVGMGLSVMGIESMNIEGSLLFGAVLGTAGIAFAAVTALCAQLSENARGATGLSIGVLLAAYLIRAIGDVGQETLSWLSPFGWLLSAEVYVNNYWWPVMLTLAASAGMFAIAYRLNASRDMGAGLLRTKPGRREASRLLRGPFTLGLRLQRVGLLFWAVGMLTLGATYGSVLGDLDAYFESNEMLKNMLQPAEGFTLTEQFMTMLMAVISMICAIPPVMAVLKLRGEERRGRTEHLVGRAISRARLMLSYTVISVVTGFVMQTVAAAGLALASSAVMEEPLSFGVIYSAAMAYLPALWIMTGISVLLLGAAPRVTSLVWLYLTYSFIVVYMGSLLQFPEWMGKLSPFGHVAKVPIEEWNVWQSLLLTFVAAMLVGLGTFAYRKRDLEG